MDKGYSVLFNAMERTISQLQAAMITLQAAQLEAEEIYMQTPSEDDEVTTEE